MKLTSQQIRDIAANYPEMAAFLNALGEMAHNNYNYRDDPILQAAWNTKRAHEKMVEVNGWLSRKAEEVARRLTYKVTAPTNELSGVSLYMGLNSCGELQGNASSYEIAVARLADAMDVLKALVEGRARDEQRTANTEELASITECASLVSAFRTGGPGTLLQLSKRLAQDPSTVMMRIARLMDAGFVKAYGKSYSFKENKEAL